MITDVETFFEKGCGRCDRFGGPDCAAQLWAAGVRALRALCLEAGLEESVKWGCPCYGCAGRNVAIIGATRRDFRLSFFEAGLMKDPGGALERQGPNTAYPDMLRFTSAEQAAAAAPTIRAYLQEAMGYAAQGLRQPPAPEAIPMPDELGAALQADSALAAAFGALTPGRRRSYLINLNGAKTSATRIRRIAAFRDKILAGKGALER